MLSFLFYITKNNRMNLMVDKSKFLDFWPRLLFVDVIKKTLVALDFQVSVHVNVFRVI